MRTIRISAVRPAYMRDFHSINSNVLKPQACKIPQELPYGDHMITGCPARRLNFREASSSCDSDDQELGFQ